MSTNPRLILAFFWLQLGLRLLAGAMDAHTATVLVVNLVGVISCPALAYWELKRGLADRRERRARCDCCGTHDNLLWRKGDHQLAVATICRACKFGACEACHGD